MRDDFTVGSGSVWRDLGLAEPTSDERRAHQVKVALRSWVEQYPNAADALPDVIEAYHKESGYVDGTTLHMLLDLQRALESAE